MRRARPHRYRHSARRVDAGGCDPSRPRRGCFAFGSLAPSARRDVVRVSDPPTSAPRSAASRRVTTPPGSILRHAGRARTVAGSTVSFGHWRQSGNPDAATPRCPHGDGSGRTRPSALRSRPISHSPALGSCPEIATRNGLCVAIPVTGAIRIPEPERLILRRAAAPAAKRKPACPGPRRPDAGRTGRSEERSRVVPLVATVRRQADEDARVQVPVVEPGIEQAHPVRRQGVERLVGVRVPARGRRRRPVAGEALTDPGARGARPGAHSASASGATGTSGPGRGDARPGSQRDAVRLRAVDYCSGPFRQARRRAGCIARRRAVATGVGWALRRRPPAAAAVPTAAP